jgi:hypothetical protein
MADDEVSLELGDLLGGDDPVAEVAKPGGDPVDD